MIKFNNVVGVAFKLFILNWWVELVLNTLFIVEFKLMIDNCPFVEKLLKFVNIVVDVAFKLLYSLDELN